MTIDDIAREYAQEHDPPIGGYALLLAAHLGLVGAVLVALDRRGVELGRIGTGELLLTGVAALKLSRTISKSWIGTATAGSIADTLQYARGWLVSKAAE